MISPRLRQRPPWWYAGISILVLLLALGTVAIIGVMENTRLQESSEQAIRYDVAISGLGDDIRVAVLDLRHHHRNIVFSGPTAEVIAEFDLTYKNLLDLIDQLEQIGVADLDVAQPDELRSLAIAYHDAFRPSIVLFTSDPVAFNAASAAGLDQIQALELMADGIDEAGVRLASESLGRVEIAAIRERRILIALLSGVALIAIVLSLLTGRVLSRLHAANSAEQAASKGLATSLRMKSAFIADASHELRTPLTLIRGNAEIGLSHPGDPDQTRALTEIHTEATRMTRLVNDLLFLARSDAGSPSIEREYVPVQWLTAKLVKPAETLVRHHGATLTTRFEASGHLHADPQRIEQAVLILVDNAARYSPQGEPVILSSRIDSNHLELIVADSGPGVPLDEQPLIFERFYQVADSGERTRGGAGLGLAIAKSIIDAHGGSIAIESEPGQGTTIRIRLPLSTE